MHLIAAVAAAELDPNEALNGIVAIALAVLGYVTLRTQQRLKNVDRKTDTLTANGGESMRDELVAISRKLERLDTESRDRAELASRVAETVTRVHANQMTGVEAVSKMFEQMGRLSHGLLSTDNRLTALENTTTDKLTRLEAAVASLEKKLHQLTPSADGFGYPTSPPTPPHGTPAVKT